mmetsp:Transcript_9496/g.21793  ORF Transcript_9496/g.21793 Transcript_9496/m.21793 type:complete len:262 (-) Transcript_9496:48-833(-)
MFSLLFLVSNPPRDCGSGVWGFLSIICFRRKTEGLYSVTSIHLFFLESLLEGRDVSSGVLFVHGLSSKAFSNHVSKDSHHGGTSVVQLNIQLADLVFRSEVGSEVANTVVSIVLGGRHPCKFDQSEEKEDLPESSSGDGTNPVNTGGDVGELEVGGWRKVSIKDNVVVVDDVSNNGSHGNTSVLTFDSTTALELLRLGVEPSERIVHSERFGHTQLEFIDHGKASGSLAFLLSGGKSRSGSNESSKHSDLHGGCQSSNTKV